MGIEWRCRGLYQGGLFWKNWQDDVKQLDGKPSFVFTPDLNQDRKIAIDERQKQEINIETHYQANFAEKNKFDLAYSVA